MTLLLIGFGFLAGYIDSIAGGGGLVTLPVLLWVLRDGPEAVGTNKVVGLTAAFVALLVYARKGHFVLAQSLWFSLATGAGAVLGSFITPYLPDFLFRWFLVVLTPVVLFILWQKDFWKPRVQRKKASPFLVMGLGFLAGLYDGMWGPGGGTLMFLSLFLVAKLPLLQAIASTKLANTFSAGFSLVSFSWRGFVHWPEGLTLAAGIGAGAFLGAHHADKRSAQIVRPILAVVTVLLILKVILE